MKTIELDGKKMYLVQSVGQVPRIDLNSLYFEGLWYELRDKPPFLYKDHNGVEVMNGQTAWEVQKTPVDNSADRMWQPESFIATDGLTEFQKSTYAIFTTKEAADKFVADNRPFELFTRDMVKITNGETWIYAVNKKYFFKGRCMAKEFSNHEDFVALSTEDAASVYIKANKPFVLITHDGVKIHGGEMLVWLVDINDYEITSNCKAKDTNAAILNDSYVFSTEQAAKDYIKKHKAVLSLDMIENGLIDEGHEWSNPVVQEVFRTITKLVNEQFKPQ